MSEKEDQLLIEAIILDNPTLVTDAIRAGANPNVLFMPDSSVHDIKVNAA